MNKIYHTILFFFLLSNISYGQNWIPYQGYFPLVNQEVNVYHTTITHQPQPILAYQLTPVTSYQNIIVEQRFLCHTTQTVVVQPITYWVYKPFVIYH